MKTTKARRKQAKKLRDQYKQATLRATYGSRMEPVPVVVKRIEPGSTLPGGSVK